MIPFGASEAEQPLLEYRVLSIPEREAECEPTLAIADAEQPVLAPAIRSASRMLVREVLPSIAPIGVVLAHGAPLALGQVGTPPLPVLLPARVRLEPPHLGIRNC